MSGGRSGLLQGISIFAGLSVEDAEDVGQACKWARYSAGRQILGQDEPTSDIFFIVEGAAQAKRFSSGGKEVPYLDIFAGELFGEFSAIDGAPRSATVVATEPSLIARMDSEAFRHVIETYPVVGLKLCELLVMKIRGLSRRVFEYSTLPVRLRVQAEILRLCEAVGCGGNEAVIDPAPTHQELALRVSTHREAVTRELNYLASQGIMEVSQRRILVSDVSRLRAQISEFT